MSDTTLSTKWIEYNNEWNQRDLRMSLLWVQKAADWLKLNKVVGPHCTVLDYGCGYFDLGRSILNDVCTADGFDPNDANFPIARGQLTEDQRAHVGLFSDPGDIPRGKYNLVLVNSVIQYFSGPDELNRFFLLMEKCVRQDEESIIVVSDIIPKQYNKYSDALNSLIVAARNGVLIAMLKHLWSAATKSENLELYRLDADEFISVASVHGWRAEMLSVNLTPSKRRFSIICRRMTKSHKLS